VRREDSLRAIRSLRLFRQLCILGCQPSASAVSLLGLPKRCTAEIVVDGSARWERILRARWSLTFFRQHYKENVWPVLEVALPSFQAPLHGLANTPSIAMDHNQRWEIALSIDASWQAHAPLPACSELISEEGLDVQLHFAADQSNTPEQQHYLCMWALSITDSAKHTGHELSWYASALSGTRIAFSKHAAYWYDRPCVI